MGEIQELYYKIQAIPYQMGFIDDFSKAGNCVSKCIQFVKEYQESSRNDIITHTNVKFDWRYLIDWDELEETFPGARWLNIAKLVNNLEDPIDDHLILMMDEVYYDMSWDPSMEKLGFPVKKYEEGIALPEKAVIDINHTSFDESRYQITRGLRKAWYKIKKHEEGPFNRALNTILYLNRVGVEMVEHN